MYKEKASIQEGQDFCFLAIRELFILWPCDSDIPVFLHWTSQFLSSDPSGQSFCPSHSWFSETHLDAPGQRTDGLTQVKAGVKTGDSVVDVAEKSCSGEKKPLR